MKNILVLTENFPPIDGGSARWFWELYSRLPRENIVIVTSEHSNGASFDKTHSLRVIRIPLKSAEWGFRSLKGLTFYWRSLRQLRKLVKQYHIQEIHCGRVIHEGVTAWLLSLICAVPYLCFVHGEDVETAATSREHKWMVKGVCRRARKLLCNSQNSVQLVERLGFAHASQCEVLHPGVDLERFVPRPPDPAFRQKMGWEGKTVLLTVGRLQRRKGQDFMIQAMPALLEACPSLLYVVVGQGECLSLLQACVAEHNLSDHVQLLTALDDHELIACYQQADLFVLPNRTIGNDIEGFGMVLVEAQACGKAVIAGDSGGTRETMEIGVTGSIIDASSVEQLVKGLVPVLTQQSYLTWQTNARAHAERHFGWDAHVAKAAHLFE